VFRENPDVSLLKMCRTLAIDHLTIAVPHAHALTKPLVKTGIAFPRLPWLKSLSIGSAPISEELRADLKTYISPNLCVVYGTNELGAVCFADPATQVKYPGTIGKPGDGMEVEIVDDDDQRCKPDQIGNMRLRAAGMLEAYVGDTEISRRAFRDGWYYPGDMASMTEDGSIMFKGRSDDLIIFNGINIYPREIELALEQHPAVQEAAAFPFRGAHGAELPGCAVILKSELEVSILEAHSMELLGVCRPRLICVVADFPKNAAGKILKRELADLAANRER
jgi:acyl-coenzyme A synthetase/AMP-(fatty) acid ligase